MTLVCISLIVMKTVVNMKNNGKSRGCSYNIALISIATSCRELNFVSI